MVLEHFDGDTHLEISMDGEGSMWIVLKGTAEDQLGNKIENVSIQVVLPIEEARQAGAYIAAHPEHGGLDGDKVSSD